MGIAEKLYGRVYVLRLGHRPSRDKRITTHVGLVARALGANGFVLSPTCDQAVIESLEKVLRRWGGYMVLECTEKPLDYASRWRSMGGEVIHLTMYGLPLDNAVDQLRSSPRPKLIVVGAEKVPRAFYEVADYNIAIGNQPHSEVAALAVFLDRLYKGAELTVTLDNAGLKVIPSPSGKKVVGIGGGSNAADDREDVWI